MRKIFPALALAAGLFAWPAIAAAAPDAKAAPIAPVAPAAPTPAVHYTTADTEIGTLLDDPAAKAILEKVVPGMTTNPQIDMARSMTLKAIQQYAPDQLTDARIAQLDAEFANLNK